VTNEVHGLRRLGVQVDVIGIEESVQHRVAEDLAGSSRSFQRPKAARALLDHVWFAARFSRSYLAYLRAVLVLRHHWRLALLRLPSEARRLKAGSAPGFCHTHFAWSTASIAVYLARLLGAQASITVHAKDIYVASKPELRRQLSSFDRIVTVCNYNVGYLNALEITGDTHGITVVPCGVSVPEDSSADQAATADVVSVGRLVEKKGFDTLIRAIALVRSSVPDVRLRIIGDGPERATLEQLIESLGVKRNVTLAGAMAHDDALAEIGSAKVFCLAAQSAADGDSDALPVVLREAMARGVPVISTNVAGIPETIDEEVGWLVDPRSPQQLATAIETALADPVQRSRRGLAGRERARERWTVETQVAGMLGVFGVGALESVQPEGVAHNHSPV
jgi:colanic acid/amylovoran biosynthesis glycosyltransferase